MKSSRRSQRCLSQGVPRVLLVSDCFVHASDLHLDAPLGSLGLLGEERRRELASLAAKAWDNLVDLCLDRRASFVVLAGDIFDEAEAGVAVQIRFHDGLRRLTDDGVRVFVCHGNHDPLSDGFRPVGDLPEGVVRFEPGDPQSHPVELRESGEVVLVSGVSFGRRSETENLALRFQGIDRHPGAPHVAVLHANVGGHAGHDPYAPCSYDDLAAASVDYWALGHIHKRDIRPLPNGGRAAYCGNLQGRSFKPAECEPKGALVVPVAGGRLGEPEFVPCDEVRFVRNEIVVESTDSILSVRDRLVETANDLGAEHSRRSVAWEVCLVGVMEEARQLQEAIAAGDLVGDAADELSIVLGGGGLSRLEAAVRTPVDRQAVLATGDLFSDVLSRLQQLRQSAVASSEEANPSGDATGSGDLEELLLEGLPTGLQDVWRELCEQRPDRLETVVDLAEELLLDVYAEAEGSRR